MNPGRAEALAGLLAGQLDAEGFRLLAARFSEQEFRQGRALCYQDEDCEAAWFLLEGSVQPVKYKLDGAPFHLRPLGRGSWVALGELLAGGRYLSDAVADEDCVALRLPRAALPLLGASAGVMAWLARCLAGELAAIHYLLCDPSPAALVAGFLLGRRRAVAGAANSAVAATQADIARATGLSRETVCKYLGEMEGRGALRTGRGAVEAIDWEAVKAIAAAG